MGQLTNMQTTLNRREWADRKSTNPDHTMYMTLGDIDRVWREGVDDQESRSVFEPLSVLRRPWDGDKNRMSGVVNWILGIGLKILGYIATKLLRVGPGPSIEVAQSAGISAAVGLILECLCRAHGLFLLTDRQ
jgi:hypothetical protein